MKKIIMKILFLFLTTCILVGCQSNVKTSASTEPSQPPITIATVPSRPTYAVSPTPVPSPPWLVEIPTENVSPIEPSAVPLITKFKQQCLKVEDRSPGETQSNGVLILEGEIANGSNRNTIVTSLLNMATGKLNRQKDFQFGHAVSPDRKLQAYEQIYPNSNAEFVISDSNGKTLKAIPYIESWGGIVDWLDDQRLVFINPGHGLLLWNPFAGGQQILQYDFPDKYAFPDSPYWRGWKMTMYDPTLTRVIYLKKLIDKNTYALWDYQKKKLIKSFENTFDFGFYIPSWSPDGSEFVAGGSYYEQGQHYELFLVSRDGQVKQLTHLNPNLDVVSSLYSWSPDGRFLAVYLHDPNKHEGDTTLGIIDTISGEIIDTCVQVSYGRDNRDDASLPVWSPDGSQLVVYASYEADHLHVILVDPNKGFANRIAEDRIPAGWMVAP